MRRTDHQQVPPATNRPFFIGLVLLALCVVGLNPLVTALEQHYTKQPIEVRKTLAEFDIGALPSFSLSSSIDTSSWQEDVETEEWCMHYFKLRDVGEGDPTEGMLLVTYYSNPRDSIPHTPEVCYRQGGAEVTLLSPHAMRIEGPGGDTEEFEARTLDIVRDGRRAALLYVIYSNGRFYHDRERVRLAIGWPGDRFTFFSKIEALVTYGDDQNFDAAVTVAERLLGEGVRELIQGHFPTNEQVRR